MLRQDQRDQIFQELEERLPTGGARGECDTNSAMEYQDDPNTDGSLLPLGVVDAAREVLVESASVNTGPHEFSRIKPAVPKYSGKSEDFSVWSRRFEAFVSMNGCLSSLRTDIEVTIGDSTKDTL